MEAANLRRREQAQRDLSLAWHTELFARSKRLPDLKKLLGEMGGQPARKQTPQEMKEAIQGMVGEFKRTRRG